MKLRGKGSKARILIAMAALAALLFAGAAGVSQMSGSQGATNSPSEGGAGIGGK